MESRAKFNLERSIEDWKTTLKSKKSFSESNVQELENHLLDLMSDLSKKDLTQEESFLVARNRIGNIDEISSEYEKVDSSAAFINTLIPYLKGALIYIAIDTLIELLTNSLLISSVSLELNHSTIRIIYLLLLVIVPLVLCSSVYFSFKKGKPILKKLINIPVLVLIIIASEALNGIMRLFIIRRLTNQIPNLYSTIVADFSFYKLIGGFLLLTFSFILFKKNKKNNEVKIAE
ncbi:hypothetical protein [Autumnicola musiva]|uniref:Uncharacterized protein n=1 Tax=Autumnicola musiva TaxID=3075589 RepID=A0ABU3DA43_9FLAO|nr:hypothetical protein [Zunongwangia sp. F117]MDT0678403.1 hypothetical protein [Zunongwangia sp. F117]